MTTAPSRRRRAAASATPITRRKRVHGHIVSLFAIAALFLTVLNVAVLLIPSEQARATSSENLEGWVWSDTGGWLSMNDTNAGAGGGTYGVNVNPTSKVVTGFGWSDNQGWMCFGSSCTVSACANGANTPAGSAPAASVDGSNRLRGWGMFCNLGTSSGWVSLNCLDTSPSSCGTSNYGPTFNFTAGTSTGFAWHGATGGVGWGWMDFSAVVVGNAEGDLFTCHDALDNDVDGDTDCDDNGCFQVEAYQCPAEETQCGWIDAVNCCSNSSDDDGDGDIDCDDSDCSSDAVCIPEICDNEIDDGDVDTDVDCDDSECSGFAACTPAWIQSQFGNIYAQQGIGGNAPPPGYNSATYCISSAGSVSNFTSEQGCIESSSVPLSLPSGGNGYVSNIGRLDVAGILAGRYGQVFAIDDDGDLPTDLAGRVYVYDRDAHGGNCPSGENFVLNAKMFNNATGPNARGSGLLVVKGCDLLISGDISYQSTGVSQYLRNLASFGAVIIAKYSGGVPVSGGNVYINPAVDDVVGLYFGEQSIHTGSTGGTFTDVQLRIYGALVGRDIQLERRYGSPTAPAEQVIFDGRGVVNPPPGTQDITRSLPTLRDTY